jgi:hypothetical protein
MRLSEQVNEIADNVEHIASYLQSTEEDIWISARDVARWFAAIRDDLTCAYNDEPIYHRQHHVANARRPIETMNAAHTKMTVTYQGADAILIRSILPRGVKG